MENKKSGCGCHSHGDGSADRKCIDGIVCNVTNCIYHTIGNGCTAGSINVAPAAFSTKDSKDTECATFVGGGRTE